MDDWAGKLVSVLVAASEAALSLLVLLCVWLLHELPGGDYANSEAVGGFFFGFLFLWLLAVLPLGALVAVRVARTGVRIARTDRDSGLPEGVPRVALEGGVATLVILVLAPDWALGNPFWLVLEASAAVALAVLLHVGVGAGGVVRRAVAGR